MSKAYGVSFLGPHRAVIDILRSYGSSVICLPEGIGFHVEWIAILYNPGKLDHHAAAITSMSYGTGEGNV